MTDAALKELLSQSQTNNLRDDITGMLLYSAGAFVQVLEGGQQEVDTLYAKIVMDERHKNIIKLAYGRLEKRIFPTWSMGFKAVSPAQFKEFTAYFDLSDFKPINIDGMHPAVTIVHGFVDSNKH